MSSAARPSTAAAAQLFQPLEHPIAEPFRTNKTLNVSRLALGSLNLVLAIYSFGLTVIVFRKLLLAPPLVLNIYLSLVRLTPSNPTAVYLYISNFAWT